MKRLTITYWVITSLMAAFILLGALIDVSNNADAVALIKHLGYPAYFVPFVGTMKIMGVIAVLIRGFPKLKEWAYAGLAFDTAAAIFSHISSGDGPDKWAPALVGLILVLASYLTYTAKLKKQCELTTVG
jgi:hypothetical protein